MRCKIDFANRKAIKKYKKQIPRQYDTKEAEEKIKAEIIQLKTYSNEYIVKYFDDIIEDNYLFIVYEYCEVVYYL